MKTASRIFGSAAFHAGFVVQDSPSYGAERRGAPIAAFARIGRVPILERGVIERPHLVVVSDETLIGDPAASPLAGCRDDTTVLVSSAHAIDLPHRVVYADFASMVLERTRKIETLSTVLGVASARLVGLETDDCLAGVDRELAHLDPAAKASNLELARDVLELVHGWEPVPWPGEDLDRTIAADLAELSLEPPGRAAPSIYASANTPARRTGNWRQFRPVLEPEKCSRCWLCFVWCPEAAIVLDDEEFPRVDYDVCKGCLLCAHECPTKAFRVEREVRA